MCVRACVVHHLLTDSRRGYLQSHRASFSELNIKIAGLVPQDQFLDQAWVPRHRFRELLPPEHTFASLFALAAAQEALSDAHWPADSAQDTRTGVAVGCCLPAVRQLGWAGDIIAQVRPQSCSSAAVGAPVRPAT